MSTISVTKWENTLDQTADFTVGREFSIGNRTMWFYYDQTTDTINASFNVSSSTDASAGKFDMNLTSAHSSITERMLSYHGRGATWTRIVFAASMYTSETTSVTKWQSATSATSTDQPNGQGQSLGRLA